MDDIWMLKELVWGFCIKKTELINLRVIKEKSKLFIVWERFCESWEKQKWVGTSTITRITDEDCAV